MPIDPIAEFRSTLPFPLDPFQETAIHALAEGRSVLVAAPTGTGKTVIAEFAVHLALSRDLRALYTAPIKALSNQKYRDFRARYGDRVGLLTGDLAENPAGRLLVMTTEVARNMLVQDPGSFQDVGCLVFDEVHYLADPERGTAWEESILLAPAYVPLVCLSATVANAEELADWIRTTGRDVSLIESFERAVPLRHRYYLDGRVHPILEGAGSLPVPSRVVRERAPARAGATGNGRGGSRQAAGPSPAALEAPQVVRALAAEGLLPAIYFLFSRKVVEETADACQRLSLLSRPESMEVRRTVRERVAGLPVEDRSLPQVERLLGLLPKGIGFHHAGMLPPLKTLVEELLAAGSLRVVFATDTLALGINVPARSVVVGEMVKFDGQMRRLLTSGEYRQLTGRAGRRGMDPVGYSILLDSPWAGLDRILEIAAGEVAPLESAFRPAYSTVLNLWQRPEDEARLAGLIAGSLRQFQDGGRIRSLAREREELETTLQGIPAGCPLDGGPVDWLEKEKELKREEERAASAVKIALGLQGALEERLSAWPWSYSKLRKQEWLRAARPGDLAYSRRFGWMVYLGPSAGGIGLFLIDGAPTPLSGYAPLDYLPDPRLQVPLGSDSTLLTPHSLPDLPDPEATARESEAQERAARAPALEATEERIAAARERHRAASHALALSPCRNCELRASHRRWERQRRSYSGELVSVQRDLRSATNETRRRAEATLRSLRTVLESFGYMAAGQPSPKAKALMRLFDSNSLILAELLAWGALADATAAEVAEVASWFAFDREGAGRALATTERLNRIRAVAEAVAKRVLEVERRHGVQLSSPLTPEFRGVGLSWATGSTLSELSARSGLAEGDLVFTLQKSIDLCRQLAQAAPHSRTPSLAGKAREAERLIRRGVVDSYYRWVVGPGLAVRSR